MTSPRLSLKTVCTLGTAFAALMMSGCLAKADYTPAEQEMLETMGAAQYQPRTAEDRAAVETQPLFAQVAFWSREYDLNPADLEAAIKLSASLRKLGNAQQALEIAQTSRAMFPQDTNLVAELGANYIALEQGKDAIAPLSSAVRQDGNNPRLWSLLGAAHDQVGQYDQARRYYERALSLNPHNANVLANVGLSYALQGDAKTAEVWLRRAAGYPDASANVRQNLAIVLGLQGKYEEAEMLARQDLAPDSAENNLAYLRAMKSNDRSYEALSSSATPASPAARPVIPSQYSQPAQTQTSRPASQPQSYGAPAAAPGYNRQATPSNTPRTYGAQGLPQSQPFVTSTDPAMSARELALSAARNSQARTAMPQGQTYSQAPNQTQSQRQPQAYVSPQAQGYSGQAYTGQPYAPQTVTKAAQQAAVKPAEPAATKDILAQISQSVSQKTAPKPQMTYRQMEEARRAELTAQREAQASYQAVQNPYQNAPGYQGATVTTYPSPGQSASGYGQYQNQYQGQYQAQAQTQNSYQDPSGYPQRRAALRSRN